MDTELLRAFIAVAESGGFSAAAKGLHRTQSAVSLQIKRLEQRLGQRLLQRTSRSVVLTEAGGTLLPYARRMLRLQDDAENAVGQSTQAPLLRFGLSEEQALAYLPDVLASFSRDNPEVHLEIICDFSMALVQRLEQGLLDLALTIRHRPTETGELIAREPLAWVGRSDCRVALTRPVPLAVNPEGCVYRAHAFNALGGAGRYWQVVYTSQNPTGINLAVQAGLGITVKTPRSVPEGCRVLDTSDGLPSLQSVNIELHRAPGSLPAAADGFCDTLLAAIAATAGVEMLSPAP